LDLRNWEHNATSGTPVAGATVEVRAASLTSPNTGPVIASTTTDANGMWEFVGLADAAVDVKITYNGNVWWHKGMTKHSVTSIYYVTPTPTTDNFFKTAGFEVGVGGPWTVASAEKAVFGAWRAINGAGSSAVLSRETTTVSADSAVSAKIVQTKVADQLLLYQDFAVPASMRGKTITVSFQVHQSVANSVRAYIQDHVGSSESAYSATTGSFVTLTVTRGIHAAATFVRAGIRIEASSTTYVDNAIWVLGGVAGTYRPEYLSAGSLDVSLLTPSGNLTLGDGTDAAAMGGTDPLLRVQGASATTGLLVGRDGNAQAGIQASGSGIFGTWTNHNVLFVRNGVTAASINPSNELIDASGNPYLTAATAAGSGLIVGEMKAYLGATEAPVAALGWKFANGQAISRTTFATLFAVIGTTFGAGDGATTFNLPDMRGRKPIGSNATYALGVAGGAYTADASHNHTGPSHVHSGPSHQHDITHTHGGLSHSHTGGSHSHGGGSLSITGSTQTSILSSGNPATFDIDDAGNGWSIHDAGHRHDAGTLDVGGSTDAANISASSTELNNTGGSSAANTGMQGTGNTGASGTATTGTGGSAAQSVMDPYVPVNFIIYTGVAS
jgi:microcystin-dependent protein